MRIEMDESKSKGSAYLPMMKLSQMSKIRNLIDEQTWKGSIGEHFAQLWRHDPGSVYFWRISSNAIFTADVDGKRHFLRLNLAAERSLSEVEAELRILLALNESTVRAAQPVASLNGRFIETAEWNGDVYHALLFEGMPGEHPDDENLTEAQCLRWGEELGRLHKEIAAMPPATFNGRSDWRRDLANMQNLLAQESAMIRTALDTAATEMERICSIRPVTLIHFDFEMDNLLWHDTSVSAIDFDDCRIYPPGADIEYAIRSLRKLETTVSTPRILAFLDGYAINSPYPTPSNQELAIFRQWHCLYLLAASHREMDLASDEPRMSWQSNLELKFAELNENLRLEILNHSVSANSNSDVS